jgi:hypothetical protein
MRALRLGAKCRLVNLVGFVAAALSGCGGGSSNVAGTGGAGTVSNSGGAGGAGPTGTGGVGTVTGTGGAGVTGSGGATSGGASGSGGSGAATGSGGSAGAGARGTGGAAATTGSGGSMGIGGAAGNAGPPIVDLFNGTDLTGWTAYRQTDPASPPGTLLTPTQAQVVFKPENGTIRAYGDAADQSTQARYTLITAQSYTKYNFWVEYRWGTKKFAPYTDLVLYPRDAGVLFHLHGDRTQVWPSSIEFQIKDGTTGDIFALFARCVSLAQSATGTTFVDIADGGIMKIVNGANGFVQHSRSANFELPDWNSLELQVNGGAAVFIVNGHIVNRVLSVSDRSGTTGMPVTSGPIALQAEHAEVFYRNVRIQVLP